MLEREHILQNMYSAFVPPKRRKKQPMYISRSGNTRKNTFSSTWNENISLYVCQSWNSPDFDKTKLYALFMCKSRFSRCWPGNGEKPEGFLGGQDLFAFCTLSSEWAASLASVDSISHFLSTPLILPCSHADIVIWTHIQESFLVLFAVKLLWDDVKSDKP